MSDLDALFITHKEAVVAVLESYTLAADCKLEIDAALSNLKTGLDDHDCDDGCSHDDADNEYEFGKDEYLIVAKNMNEVDRIEGFIEELKNNPYTP